MQAASYKKYFTYFIQQNYPANADKIISDTDKHYEEIAVDIHFAATSRNPVDHRLDFCAYFLALIKTLDAMGEDFANIRKICLEIVIEYVKPKNKWQVFLKSLPPKLIGTWIAGPLLKAFHNKVSSNENKEGFIANIITDKEKTFGFGYGVDIIECGICKLFKKHNYYKYASILCEVDKVTSGLAGLELIRTGTIANGADKCDFRFKKMG